MKRFELHFKQHICIICPLEIHYIFPSPAPFLYPAKRALTLTRDWRKLTSGASTNVCMNFLIGWPLLDSSPSTCTTTPSVMVACASTCRIFVWHSLNCSDITFLWISWQGKEIGAHKEPRCTHTSHHVVVVPDKWGEVRSSVDDKQRRNYVCRWSRTFM